MAAVGHQDLIAVGIASLAVIGADHQDPGQLPLRAGGRLQRDRAHAGDLGQGGLELPEQLERALRHLVGRQRMERREAGQPGRPLVELGVELHRAGAQRVEASVDREVQLREVDVVAHDLGFVELGQARGVHPAGVDRDACEGILGRVRDLAAATSGAATLEQGGLQLRTRDAHRRLLAVAASM